MFVIKGFSNKELEKLYQMHRMIISTENVYFQNIRALKTRNTQMISRECYLENIAVILSDMDVESEPIETIIPNDSEDIEEGRDSIFSINTEIPEFQRAKNRLTYDEVIKLLPQTSDAYVKITEHPEKIDLFVEEAFVFFLMDRYAQMIDKLHLRAVSNVSNLIEFVVNTIDEKALRSFIHTTKINFDKAEKLIHEIAFVPEYKRTIAFYTDAHGDVPVIDVEKIVSLLLTNADTKADIAFVTALYLTFSYAMVDIVNEQKPNDEFPHVVYIRDTLSKLQ